MPIGNGVVGLNVWVEQNGDLRFYVARKDSWAAPNSVGELMKLGGIRISLSPNPFLEGNPFRQELLLKAGRIEIQAGKPGERINLSLFVDAEAPVIHVSGSSEKPVTVRATFETWRTGKEADTVAADGDNAFIWYLRNLTSPVAERLRQEDLDPALIEDPFLNRSFGGRLSGTPKWKVEKPGVVGTEGTVSRFDLKLATHSAITPTQEEWVEQLRKQAERSSDVEAAAQRTAAWWKAYWERSWIFVRGDSNVVPLPSGKVPLCLGSDSKGGNAIKGAIARASVYSRPLTVPEVETLAGARPGAALPVVESKLASFDFSKAEGPDAAIKGAMVFGEKEGIRSLLLDGKAGFQLENTAVEFREGLSFEAWVLVEKDTSGCILDRGGLQLKHTKGRIGMQVGTQDFPIRFGCSTALKVGEWNHLAFVYNPVMRGRQLFINGLMAYGDGGGADQPTPSAVTRAYVLQSWMTACAAGGGCPIKFNGSLFTVDAGWVAMGAKGTPDFRQWGGGYWWQNTRHPYYAMLAQGRFEMMAPLFRFYERGVPLCKARAAREAAGVKGLFLLEDCSIYHTRREGPKGNPFSRHIYQQAMELSMMMLDYYEHTWDEKFLIERALPMAREALLFYDTRFRRDAHGKLVITPTNVEETYWTHEETSEKVVNDILAVSALHTLPSRLLELAASKAEPEVVALWERMRDAAPAVPTLKNRKGQEVIAPAEQYTNKRHNTENVEFYSIWPYKLFSITQPNLELALATYENRIERNRTGWCYNGPVAARLGLADEAKAEVLSKVFNSHGNFRFPVMWGPNFDWLPDQDNGSQLMITLQEMLLHTDGKKIILFPAWPKEWDVRFKLYAPCRTCVEAVYEKGKLLKLAVLPKERLQDLALPQWLDGNNNTR